MDPTQFLTRLKKLASALTPVQIATLAVSFLGIVAVVGGSALWLGSTPDRLLFSDMDAESAAGVVSRLKALDVPYELDEGGRSIRVPADRVDELRLELSAQGLPASGRIGFEIFDRTAFGATEFLEHVNYRRALEGEIARTIATLSEVAGARVHISMAKDSLFTEREQPAKASVVLALKNRNRPLAPSAVTGIVRLVAASVEGLRPEAVVIVDDYGRPLVRPQEEGEAASDGLHVERQQQIERDMTLRLVSLLEPVVGENRVRANVSVRLNTQSQEETQEVWDPTTVMRSRQTSSEGAAGMSSLVAAAGAVAGARSNLPPAQPAVPAGQAGAAAPAAAAPPPTQVASASTGATPVAARTAETTNFEVGKTVRHTVRPRGDIARVSVAVLIDHEPVVKQAADGTTTRAGKPRTPGDLQKIQAIVAAAVGLDTSRGDQLTVENIPFDSADEPVEAAPGTMERYGPQLMEGARIVAIVLLGLGALLGLIRPAVRRALGALPSGTPLPQLPQNLPRTVDDLQGELAAQLDAGAPATAESRQLLGRRVTALAQKEPENVARVIRGWLSEEEAL